MSEEDLKELRMLARQCQGMSGTYTRMYGPQGNGDRVADLQMEDAYRIGTRMMEILDENI